MTVATYFEEHLHATSGSHATSGRFHTKNALEHAPNVCNRWHTRSHDGCRAFCSLTVVMLRKYVRALDLPTGEEGLNFDERTVKHVIAFHQNYLLTHTLEQEAMQATDHTMH